MIHDPHQTHRPLEGQDLEDWARQVGEELIQLRPYEAASLTVTLLLLTRIDPNDDGRRDARTMPAWTHPCIERLRDLGVLFIFYTQGRKVGAVRLHAYDPPAPWVVPSEPTPTGGYSAAALVQHFDDFTGEPS
jgi:hypothetical protein